MKVIKIFTIGVFDMFHYGHLRLFENAKLLGDHLTVGIVKDKAVRRYKGNNRPIINELMRANIVRALKAVDAIMLMNEFAIPENMFNQFDIFVIGEDQQHIKNIEKIPPKKLTILPREKSISTSDIIKKIKNDNL